MNKSLEHQPLLIIAFARPEGVRRIIDLAITYGVSKIFVSTDGPRNSIDSDRLAKIQRVVSEFEGHPGIQIVTNQLLENHGVASGVIHALDWFFSNVESGIVLEDDIVPTNSFFEFCETALTIYSMEPRVKMISGTQVFPDESDRSSALATTYPMIWGWAAWAKDWHSLRSHFFELKPTEFRSIFDYRWQYWSTGARRAISGIVDTWDTPIAFQFFNRKLLAITPPINLVTNVGADEVASHTSENLFPLNLPRFEASVNDFIFPSGIALESKEYSNKLERELFRIKYRHWFSPILSKLFDYWRFKKSRKMKPLKNRVKELKAH